MTHQGFKKVPILALQLCYLFDAVIVGSGAYHFANEEDIPSLQSDRWDIDVVVPIDKWVQACKLIPQGARVNSLGGFTFDSGGFKFDVWADDAARVVLNAPTANVPHFIWSPKYGGKVLALMEKGEEKGEKDVT